MSAVSGMVWMPCRRKHAGSGWARQLAAPLALGGAELLPALAKLGGALTVHCSELLRVVPCKIAIQSSMSAALPYLGMCNVLGECALQPSNALLFWYL